MRGVEAEEKTSRLCFDTSTYWQGCTKQFLPEINSVFQVLDAVRHYHVPVDINQFGHSASRGD
ncbi:hydroxyisourate hydrolase [Paracoccus cavernae]|uniref:hydroxyisourate hydrolase n=1 Tax=Paracoccus cavernae TaxID=1571207 RepID=UPI003645206A